MTLIAERNPRVNAIWWTFLACLVVVITAIDNPVTHLWVKHDPTVVGAIAAIALIGGCFRGWRIGLRIDQSGMTVRNYFRTYRIGWPEVSLFADGSALGLFAGGQSPGGDFGWGWALRVVRGSPVPAGWTVS